MQFCSSADLSSLAPVRLVEVQVDERAINVFTDGSSLPSPRRGGVGVHIVVVDEDGDEVAYDLPLPGFSGATNNQMELQAPIEALLYLAGRYSPVDPADFDKILIITDSNYVAENFDNARFYWPKAKWMTRDGNPVLNADLWKDLVRAANRAHRRVEIRWGKGHSRTNPHNKVADKLAKTSARGVLQPAVRPKRVRRKQSDRQTDPGSIPSAGQRVTVRIITDEWLPVQRMYQYKVEVADKDSPHDGCVADFFSKIMLSAGHIYEVRLGDDPKQPRIAEQFGEVTSG